MLIDRSHTPWMIAAGSLGAAGLALYLWLDRTTPGGLTGGSTVGLWYGVVAAALMVYAGLLSALRRVPAWWWLGPRKRWLRGHIWLGLLSLVFVLCHSGFHIGGPLERLLWVIYGLTLATGLFGLALQQFMPRTLTTGLTSEAPYEQLPHISEVLRRKADVLASRVMANESASMQVSMFASQVGVGAKLQFQKFYEAHVRPFLRDGRAAGGPLATALAAEQAFERLSALPGLAGSAKELTELEALCAERRALAEQERLHRWLHGWLLIHVPLSVVLLVLGVTHIIAALYY